MLNEKLDVVRLTFYTAPVSLICLAPFCYAYEVGAGALQGGARLFACLFMVTVFLSMDRAHTVLERLVGGGTAVEPPCRSPAVLLYAATTKTKEREVRLPAQRCSKPAQQRSCGPGAAASLHKSA